MSDDQTPSLVDRIPANVRALIYSLFGFLITVESTLDAFEYGVVPERPQAAVIAVMAALGFGLARYKTPV